MYAVIFARRLLLSRGLRRELAAPVARSHARGPPIARISFRRGGSSQNYAVESRSQIMAKTLA